MGFRIQPWADANLLTIAGVYLSYNAPPLIIIFLFRLKKIKGVSLTISTFSFITLFVTSLTIGFFAENEAGLRVASNILHNLGLRGMPAKITFLLIFILIGALVAWQALRILKYYYN